jgi:GcrA cell cycle regulator
MIPTLSPPKLAELRRLWSAGETPRRIALALGGLTAFEVVAIAKGLGLIEPSAQPVITTTPARSEAVMPVEPVQAVPPADDLALLDAAFPALPVPAGLTAAQTGAADGWTNERVERAKQLWSLGWTASGIAGELGGVTRAAVLGKLDRLGMTGKRVPREPKPPVKAKPAPQGRRIKITRPEAQRVELTSGPESGPVSSAPPASAKAPRTRGAGAGQRPNQRAARPTNSGPPDDLVDGFDDSAADGLRHEKTCFAAIEGGVRLLDATQGRCRWPHGAGEAFRFCGGPVESRSLCAAHYAMAYVPIRQPTEAQREQGRKLARRGGLAAGEATWT